MNLPPVEDALLAVDKGVTPPTLNRDTLDHKSKD
jgi:hypothetical protein